MVDRTMTIKGVQLPRFLYGTAWKEDDTQCLTELALQNGFRGIDTANQRRHYNEAAVGQAIAVSIKNGLVARDELFLQTKFTFRRGQDDRLPYDPAASIAKQVEQSVASSLIHLGIEVVDSYLLHGPSMRVGLTASDWEAWRAMENIKDSGRIRLLGISNVSLEQLQTLCQQAHVQPSFVQNRCYAIQGWDREIRKLCNTKGIVYQGFSLLTANREAMAREEVVQLAKRHHCTVSQIIFRFALEVGMVPLTGTSDSNHMAGDLQVFDLRLDPNEVMMIESLIAK